MGTAMIALLALSLLTGIGSGLANYGATKRANEFNQQQYEDWKSYNTPAQQMQRLGDAGLNPYMVSGVNNTLSQPFAVGQNNGIAEMFQGISGALKSGASNLLGAERNDIAQTNAETKKTEANIHSRLADLRERMVILAEKRNDPMMALLWGQADAQTLGNMVLKNSAPDIISLRHYQALRAAEDYDFITKMHPMQLDTYMPYQRARINQMMASAALANANVSHLNWYEDFALQQAMREYFFRNRSFEQRKNEFQLGFGQRDSQFNRRLRLSEDYYDLARNKFRLQMFNDLYDKAFPFRLNRTTKGGAGQFPSWTEYEYGY